MLFLHFRAVRKEAPPALRSGAPWCSSFPRKREPSGVRRTTSTLQTTLDPRFRGDDASVTNRRDASRLALGWLRHFVFWAPTSVSHLRNASTTALASNVGTCGYCASHPSYSGRPNSRIASWLSFGAIDSGTFFTDGPG